MERRAFLFVGNSPWLDFVNTRPVVDGQAVELLAEPADVVAWLVAARLLTAEAGRRALARRDDGLAEHARSLRESLRGLAGALASGRPMPTAAVAAIDACLAESDGCLRLSRHGARFALAFEPRAAAEERLLAPVAESAARLLAEGDPALVKHCEGGGCVLFFHDTTKNHARRWCSMDGCGNRAKVAAFRQRREAAQSARRRRSAV